MMRYLLISFCLLLVSCGSYSKKKGLQETVYDETILTNPYFSNQNTDYVYKAQIDVYDKHFSGLLIIKKIEKENHRVAFTTEMGNKLFDFSFINNTFKVNYIIDDFDKSILINILKQDYRTLIQENSNITNTFKKSTQEIHRALIYNKTHYYFFNNQQLVKIVRAKGSKEKVSFLFSNISDSIAKQIEIQHYNIKFKTTLNSIK
jgi:hypothetical protein